ncbi:T9SS type A sorting domain-containing protein [Flavobacterium sp. SM15]|uniref:T9SS type A sorting domain-containing protein n=1 Tax=Flavobacterium sp. SM15 TaxID=2908005 RepID=UPI001EDC54AD|nr:T9SS type A sorting domain-containing protein [Flavobacterium sp. SM15]MCG2610178.1 T9SS type A sorting domain-containing protein [Flavobacterium sp. SM15]
MKLKLFLVASLFSLNAFSQITFEHEYTTSSLGGDDFVSAFYTQTELNHFTFDKNTGGVQIFNQTHVLTTSFTVPIMPDWKFNNFLLISDKLFNNDANIEFLISEYNDVTMESKIVLVSSDGSLIQEFAGATYASVFKDSAGQYKLITKKIYSDDFSVNWFADLKVYSLQGTLTVNQYELFSKNVFAFPNPTEGQITFENLKLNGEKGKLEVFTTNGMKVLQKDLSGAETNTALDTSALSSGVYVYKINGTTGKFIKK